MQASKTPKQLFCFGVGYVSLALAHHLRPLNWVVSGTCRTQEKVRWLEKQGISAFQFNGPSFSPALQKAVQDASHILITIPPVPYRVVDADSVQLLKDAEWIGYLSSTSVYGDWSGDWVDEKSETRTKSERGTLRLSAEEEWLQLFHRESLPVHVFRLGGIYGPRRNLLMSLTQGKSSANKTRRGQQQFINRCHVYDICQVLVESMENPHPGEIYCVVDDQPTSRSFALEIAEGLITEMKTEDLIMEDILGPAFKEKSVKNRSTESSLEEKRVRNQKIKSELGISLRYPDISSGLHAISRGDNCPFNKDNS